MRTRRWLGALRKRPPADSRLAARRILTRPSFSGSLHGRPGFSPGSVQRRTAGVGRSGAGQSQERLSAGLLSGRSECARVPGIEVPVSSRPPGWQTSCGQRCSPWWHRISGGLRLWFGGAQRDEERQRCRRDGDRRSQVRRRRRRPGRAAAARRARPQSHRLSGGGVPPEDPRGSPLPDSRVAGIEDLPGGWSR